MVKRNHGTLEGQLLIFSKDIMYSMINKSSKHVNRLFNEIKEDMLYRHTLTDAELEEFSKPLTKTHLINYATNFSLVHSKNSHPPNKNVSAQSIKSITLYVGKSKNELTHADAL